MTEFDLSRLDTLFSKLDEMLASSPRTVLAVDGRCASGKTTAAELIAGRYGAETVHMDHFFLPQSMRTSERLSEPGGNLHRERFCEEVISHLRDACGFTYNIFSCSLMDFSGEKKVIAPSKLIICEGSYSLHPFFGRYYDLAVFSDVAPEEQLRRIRNRNGNAKAEIFKSRWIPMEERYFSKFSIMENCDLII